MERGSAMPVLRCCVFVAFLLWLDHGYSLRTHPTKIPTTTTMEGHSADTAPSSPCVPPTTTAVATRGTPPLQPQGP